MAFSIRVGLDQTDQKVSKWADCQPALRGWGLALHQESRHYHYSASLGTLILESQNGPRTQIGAIAVRAIEKANTVDFMEGWEISYYDLT